MKKILLTMAVAVLTVAASAQSKFYVGGSVGYSSESFDGAINTSSFKILPEIGYVLNDKMTIGAEFGYDLTSNKNSTPSSSTGTLSVSPYFRYTLFNFGNVSIFGDGMVSVSTENTTTTYSDGSNTSTGETNLGFYIKPGLAYNLNNKICLVAKFGDIFGYSSNRENKSGAKATNTLKMLELNNKLTFGCYYNF